MPAWSSPPGLDDDEIAGIESRYGFRFPPDLRAFLQRALATSDKFVNWREAPPEQIEQRLAWPAHGICFDIEHNDFWYGTWGQRPHQSGNPIFSIYQTDIIYYGANLQNYLENEFSEYFHTPSYRLEPSIRRIDFWTDLVDANNE